MIDIELIRLSSELNVEGIVGVLVVPGLPVQHGDDEAAVGTVEAVDGSRVLVADGEVEELEVFLNAGGRHRLGDDSYTALNLRGIILSWVLGTKVVN